MDRVGRYVSIPLVELHADDDKIVDMIKVLAYALLGNVWIHIVNDKVSRSTIADLCSNVRWEVELTFTPRYFNL